MVDGGALIVEALMVEVMKWWAVKTPRNCVDTLVDCFMMIIVKVFPHPANLSTMNHGPIHHQPSTIHHQPKVSHAA